MARGDRIVQIVADIVPVDHERAPVASIGHLLSNGGLTFMAGSAADRTFVTSVSEALKKRSVTRQQTLASLKELVERCSHGRFTATHHRRKAQRAQHARV